MSKIIIANWKMNPISLKEARSLLNSICKKIKEEKGAEIVFCPPFIYFSVFEEKLPSNIKMGAQNSFWEEVGAFTGEVSVKQLSDLKCVYVVSGHSERRKYFSETNEIINRKLKVILDNNLIPVLCVGETQEQRDRGEVQNVLESQISEALSGISEAKIKNQGILMAYEPIWAIGTGRPCDVEESQKMNLLIKKLMSEVYSPSILKSLKVIYGGSVNSKNASDYINEAGYDGLLVGGASLKADEFSQIVKNCA